jgi:hypothetical protein
MGNIINRVFESAGPDGKVRGTPQQIIDKYQALARDAQVAGDRVAAESYLQFSEHYSRILGEAQRQQMENQQRFNPGGNGNGQDDQRGDQNPQGGEEGGYDQQRRPQQQPNQQPQFSQPQFVQPVASGLTTIDTVDDADDFGGPIETPENRRSRRYEPAPVAEATPAPTPAAPQPEPVREAAADAAPAPAEAQPAEPQPVEPQVTAEEPAPKPKRTRRRRTTSADVPGDTPPAEASAPEPVSE